MTEKARVNDFVVSDWKDFDPKQAAHQQDHYHMYTYVGRNASNTSHHHPQGDVGILYAFTSPKDPDIQGDQTKRYIVIVDQWSGKAIRIGLPEMEEHKRKKINADGIRPDGEEYGAGEAHHASTGQIPR